MRDIDQSARRLFFDMARLDLAIHVFCAGAE
jgi:hypothetical protein